MNKSPSGAMTRTLAIAGIALTCWMTAVTAADAPLQTLRGADAAAADQAPGEKPVMGKRPGRQQVIARSFEEQPPLIPHAVQNFDEITADENQCLSCHDEANYRQKEAPLIGKSHVETPAGTVDKARWFCTQCHVPQHDALPLIDNQFQSAGPPAAP
jgi:cytochrome c-type protein NapB